MKIFSFFQQIQNSLTTPFNPCILLGFTNLPKPNPNKFLQIIPQIEPIFSPVNTHFEQDYTSKTWLGEISFDNHTVKLLANSAGLPEHLIPSCIHTAHWQIQFKEQILASKATITLIYDGNETNPVERYIALYKVAACFYEENLLGIINEPAWTFHPSHLLNKIVLNNHVNLCRNSPPFLYWTGFIKTSLGVQSPFQSAKNNCFFTKGHHVFGIPDLAYFSENANPLTIQKLFIAIIEYAWFENKQLLPGDYIALSEKEIYELVEPDEIIEFLHSPTKTLILKSNLE